MAKLRKTIIRILVILILTTVLTGCDLFGEAEGEKEVNQGDQVLTAAAETVAAHMTQQVVSSALTLQAEVESGGGEASDEQDVEEGETEGEDEGTSEEDEPPTEEPSTEEPAVETTEPPPQDPTDTNTPEPFDPTATEEPCNKAKFVSDVTIPDDTVIGAGASFDKIWRLKNVGSCEWTSGYDLIYDHGDRMNAPNDVDFLGSVEPGETVDLAVSLTAPTDGGTYRADFMLRSSDGIVFGIGDSGNKSFYVRIIVDEPTATPTNTATSTPTSTATLVPKADLQITTFTLNPATPVKGQPVHVSITVMNEGTAASGPYHVEWWASTGASTPVCTFDITNSNAGGGRVLECDYPGYPSWYASIVTKAVADPGDLIDELDETNNESLKTISVTNP